MIVDLLIPPVRQRVWHLRLAATLGEIPGVAVRIGTGAEAGATADLLLAFEALVYGRGRPSLADEAPTDRSLPSGPAEGSADLVVDVTGRLRADGAGPRLFLTIGGLGVDDGAVAAVVDGRVPVLDLDHGDGAVLRPIARWAVAVEEPRVLRTALDGVFARALQLVVRTVAAFAADRPPDALPATDDDRPVARRHPAGFALRSLSAKIAGRLRRHLVAAPAWRVAIRSAEGHGLPDPAAGPPFHILADDGRRYFADPFIFRHEGRTALFVEEFPFATQKGILSVATVGDDGRPGHPVPFLETGVHLSYPQVFAHDGAILMIPESSASASVELWRCERFPDRWTRVARLIEGRDLSDATVMRTAGGWAMLATQRGGPGASSWDALDLFTAPDLLGPWSAHPDNPVLVDVAAARPGGAVLAVGGRMIRPVQDCSRGYGSGLGFAAIDRLDEGGFRQTVLATIATAEAGGGIHTYNRSAGYEVVDLFGSPSAAARFLRIGPVRRAADLV